MKRTMLRVRAVGDTRVVDLEAMNANARRFVGRVWDDEAKDFVATKESAAVPDRHEYRVAIEAGELELVNGEIADATRPADAAPIEPKPAEPPPAHAEALAEPLAEQTKEDYR